MKIACLLWWFERRRWWFERRRWWWCWIGSDGAGSRSGGGAGSEEDDTEVLYFIF
ncbi:hypothetical protein Hanom_Chr11g00975831 [Helianthus anomalus]